MAPCPLCTHDGGERVAGDEHLRIILAEEPFYPAFVRVIWNRHQAEMTDLSESERIRLMQAVFAVEGAVRRVLAPQKINLASLGNVVPHLHWHVVPRWSDDAHFPASVWSVAAGRDAALLDARADWVRERLPVLRAALGCLAF